MTDNNPRVIIYDEYTHVDIDLTSDIEEKKQEDGQIPSDIEQEEEFKEIRIHNNNLHVAFNEVGKRLRTLLKHYNWNEIQKNLVLFSYYYLMRPVKCKNSHEESAWSPYGNPVEYLLHLYHASQSQASSATRSQIQMIIFILLSVVQMIKNPEKFNLDKNVDIEKLIPLTAEKIINYDDNVPNIPLKYKKWNSIIPKRMNKRTKEKRIKSYLKSKEQKKKRKSLSKTPDNENIVLSKNKLLSNIELEKYEHEDTEYDIINYGSYTKKPIKHYYFSQLHISQCPLPQT